MTDHSEFIKQLKSPIDPSTELLTHSVFNKAGTIIEDQEEEINNLKFKLIKRQSELIKANENLLSSNSLVLALEKDLPIIESVVDTLHAHNRPDAPINNESRLDMRDRLEGVFQRLHLKLVAWHKDKK